MGTFSDASAFYGLKATGTPLGTNVSGTVTIGVGQTQVAFTDADIAYSFKVTSTGASDVATLTLSSGLVAQTTGTPTITDGDGKDFEGVTLPTLATLYAVVINTGTITSGVLIAPTQPAVGTITTSLSNQVQVTVMPSGAAITSQTIPITFLASGQDVTLTIVGKTA